MADETFERFRRKLADVVTVAINRGLEVGKGKHFCPLGCAGNDGGDTRCDEFALMSEDDRTSVVEELLAEQSGEEPTEGTVQLTVSAASYHCLSPDARDDLVRDVLG